MSRVAEGDGLRARAGARGQWQRVDRPRGAVVRRVKDAAVVGVAGHDPGMTARLRHEARAAGREASLVRLRAR